MSTLYELASARQNRECLRNLCSRPRAAHQLVGLLGIQTCMKVNIWATVTRIGAEAQKSWNIHRWRDQLARVRQNNRIHIRVLFPCLQSAISIVGSCAQPCGIVFTKVHPPFVPSIDHNEVHTLIVADVVVMNRNLNTVHKPSYTEPKMIRKCVGKPKQKKGFLKRVVSEMCSGAAVVIQSAFLRNWRSYHRTESIFVKKKLFVKYDLKNQNTLDRFRVTQQRHSFPSQLSQVHKNSR